MSIPLDFIALRIIITSNQFMQFGSFVLVSSLESQIGWPELGADFVVAEVSNLASEMSQMDPCSLMPIWLKILHSFLWTLPEIAWGKSHNTFLCGFCDFAHSNHGSVEYACCTRNR